MKRIFILSLIISLTYSVQGFAQYNKGVLIEPVLKTDTTAIGQKISFPNTPNEEVTIAKVTIHPGDSTGWHKHEYPVFAYVLKGTLSVRLQSGAKNKFTKNGCFAEVVNTFHNGFNEGKEDVVLIAFYLGEKGRALSVKK